jgi:hypothetical protein
MAFLTTRSQRIVIGTLVLLAALGGLFVYNQFFREEDPPFFESDEEHFLYGSVGTEPDQGIPYWIWVVLPRIFPEYLPAPGGYAAVGLLARDGHEMPIGLSKVTVGFPRVGINCAMCHTASFRAAPDDVPTIYPAAASHQTGEQEYLRFLIRSASDPRFNATTILNEIAKNTRLSFMDRLLYRFAIIPGTKRALLQLQERDSWMDGRPDWGRGRIDPFNPVKFGILRQPIDSTIGNSDMMPLWNEARREGTAYHWDGLNTTLREVVQSSALGDGASQKWVERDYAKWNETDKRKMASLRRVFNYIGSLQAPKYPLPVDQVRAAAGAPIYKAQCAECHEQGGRRFGSVIPLEEVGTDRHRLDMWTAASATAYNAYGNDYSWKFSKFQKTNGYTAVPLDGIWLTAPYLHNGSVPTLADLLEPVDQRPKQFWRGLDLFDAVKVGWVSDGGEAERIGTRLDVSRPGNSNAGHTYGTTLSAEDKQALLEYMKTL